MAQFWNVIHEVIARSDIILEVLDARVPDISRNEELERKVEKSGKQLIYVLNKCDLVSQGHAEAWKKKLKPSVFVSTKKMYGMTMLRERILRYAPEREVVVGVIGYPNTGKSSVINALKGKKAAKTSSVSGYTKGLQKVRIDNRIQILDTPGVLAFKESDEAKHALIGAKSIHQIKDPEFVALSLIVAQRDAVLESYGINDSEDEEDMLTEIAEKFSFLAKGGLPDLKRAGNKVIDDWQKGKLNKNYDLEF
ncbi:50S ribosome-binding GTPase [Candidatus Woesearchaeota archaeon]|nr:50S ribosome-binding GTPase [Candidatus Woesearchaeota archaeon]